VPETKQTQPGVLGILMAKPPLKLDGPTLLLLAGQWGLITANCALYFGADGPRLPLVVHVLISVVAIHLAFTIWHEATHGTICNRRNINYAAGILGMLPYMTPFFMQRHVHLEHHKHLNVPELDPNHIYAGGPYWQLPLRYYRAITYTRNMLKHDPRTRPMRISDTCVLGLVFGIYLAATLTGHLFDVLLLWFVPALIAKVIMDWYVNFLPHYRLPVDRFLGTRLIDVKWMTPLLLCHNYHAIHHLWPTIPWHRYIARYHEKRDYLVANGVPIETRLFGGRLYPSIPLKGEDVERTAS
jgi:fatty acid desaturase